MARWLRAGQRPPTCVILVKTRCRKRNPGMPLTPTGGKQLQAESREFERLVLGIRFVIRTA